MNNLNNINFGFIKYIFLDLDDTLCDLRAAEKEALMSIETKLINRGIDSENFQKLFNCIKPKLLESFLNGNISKKKYEILRFSHVLEKLNFYKESFSHDLNSAFKKKELDVTLFNDVIPFLEFIIGKFNVAILTNGASNEQRIKISNTFLDNYIKYIYISEEVGFAKPNLKYYEYVLKDLGIEPTQAIMIGDSVECDYEGAKSIGMPSILLDRYKKK